MVDHIMDRYLDDYLALDPLSATYLGVSGHDDEVPDLSPDGLAEVSALRRRTLRRARRGDGRRRNRPDHDRRSVRAAAH